MALVLGRMWECDVCGYRWIYKPEKIPTHCADKDCHSRQWNSGKRKPQEFPPQVGRYVYLAAGEDLAAGNMVKTVDGKQVRARIEEVERISVQTTAAGGCGWFLEDGGAPQFAPAPDQPVVATLAAEPKIAEAAAENSRPTPSDMTWADYDASAGKPDEVEGPEVIPESERCQYSEFDRETGETYRCALRVHDRKIRHQKGERV